ncbi:MAG: hypothetical protein EBR07_06145 [Planctomycetes bacterium]|nr:hypothetical protein [Planctomycetota bacterium]
MHLTNEANMLATQYGQSLTPHGDFSMYHVVRRNGEVVEFNPTKIAVAITKAYIGVHGHNSMSSVGVREQVAQLTNMVILALQGRKPDGGSIHIEEIQDQVELALMRSGEHEVARAYVLYREERRHERDLEGVKRPDTQIHVVHANGERKELNIKHVYAVIQTACEGLLEVNPKLILDEALKNLAPDGVIRIGAEVKPGDILVGKVSPKSKSELSPEEKLLHAIFGRAGEDVKNDSLEVPAGTEGIVIGARRFSRRMHLSDEQKKALKKEMSAYEDEMDRKTIQLFKQMVAEINKATGSDMVDPSTRQKVGASDLPEVIIEQIENFNAKWIKGSADAKANAETAYGQFWPRVQALREEKERKLGHMKRGDELASGVLEMVKVYLATKRQLSVGDKMAGRHGNKGVIARIVPEEDMPFMCDGTPVDVLLNPLGVPSRMNVGQILEVHLGWAAKVMGFQAVTPVFDGATEAEIMGAIDEANKHVRDRVQGFEKTGKEPGHPRELLAEVPFGGKVQLHDGRTGEPFHQKTTVGYMYLLKLHHLVDDKIHARSTGPYSLITQQPLGGKARTGGQRFGEMEVWALEAYGAAYVLQELLTVKSDDVEGRTKIYDSMVKGTNTLQAGMPVVFDVLCHEIKGLGMNIQLEKLSTDAAPLL